VNFFLSLTYFFKISYLFKWLNWCKTTKYYLILMFFLLLFFREQNIIKYLKYFFLLFQGTKTSDRRFVNKEGDQNTTVTMPTYDNIDDEEELHKIVSFTYIYYIYPFLQGQLHTKYFNLSLTLFSECPGHSRTSFA